ncbi:hypothetical protein ACIFQM_11125 [Paenibacillus sp. NRS-1782]|uniref:hypothetical protein n=1 Tax=unclassified Paenibacillus TaxID=185978 RepID=UPI003D2BBDF8
MSAVTLEKPKVSAGGSGNEPPHVVVIASGNADFNNEGRHVYGLGNERLANRG